MVTEVMMKRKLFDVDIHQSSKTGMLSVKDLIVAGNKWRVNNDLPPFNLQEHLRKESTKEFIRELEHKYGCDGVYKSTKGKNSTIMCHPYLFFDIALAISPSLKIEVYSWLFDSLIELRNESGDSYKKMCGALYSRISNKSSFPKLITETAVKIQQACEVDNWQTATEKQLKIRDKIHETIFVISDFVLDCEKCVDLAIIKVISNNTKELK